jgi:hypothetical protein
MPQQWELCNSMLRRRTRTRWDNTAPLDCASQGRCRSGLRMVPLYVKAEPARRSAEDAMAEGGEVGAALLT